MPKKGEKIQAQPKRPKKEKGGARRIKVAVVGIGGGGANIVSEISQRVGSGVSFLAADTDFKTLNSLSHRVKRLQFGGEVTKGLGTGMNPEIARLAAQKEKEKIRQALAGKDFIILISSLGGGVGTGTSSVFAKISQELGSITYGIFSLPFSFEGTDKMEISIRALKKLRGKLNAFTVFPNERIFQIVDKETPLTGALSVINKSLAESLQNLIDIIAKPSLINIDFADIRTIFNGRGSVAYLNTAEIEKGREKESVESMLNYPLFPYGIKGAKGVLFNIWGPAGLSLGQLGEVSKAIFEKANEEAKIIFGISQTKARSATKITILTTGCSFPYLAVRPKPAASAIKAPAARTAASAGASAAKSSAAKSSVAAGAAAAGAAAAASAAKKKKRKRRSEEAGKGGRAKPKKEKGKGREAKGKRKRRKAKDKREGRAKAGAGKGEKNPLDKGRIDKAGKEAERQKEPLIRKDGLSVKREAEEEEARLLAKEKFWETPAFLRKKTSQGPA